MSNKTQGFTLIQVGMVMVIIGLVTGGVVVGAHLLRSSQLLGVLSEAEQYTNAIKLFKEKYHELPGDMSNATQFWGADANCPDTPFTETLHKETCNGDGNGRITDWHDDDTTIYETFRMWQQLSNAGFLSGAYNGIVGEDGIIHNILGINSPESGLPKAGWMVFYDRIPGGDTENFPSIQTKMLLAGPRTVRGTAPAVMTPAEAQLLDQKVDDGMPAYGAVGVWKLPLWPSCITSDTQKDALYNALHTNKVCGLIFYRDF